MKRKFKALMFGVLSCTLFLVHSTGCKEGCTDVVCSPAPPALIVVVRDTMTVTVETPVFDTLTQDTVLTSIDTVLVFPTSEANVYLYSVENNLFQEPVATLTVMAADTSYMLSNLSGVSGSNFGIIASRDGRSDTLSELKITTVEGCCGYSVIGNYVMELDRE